MLLAGCAGLAARGRPSHATELLTNGNFESGTCSSLTGWTVTDQAGSAGSFYGSTPGASTPDSSDTTAANASGGSCYAVSDQHDYSATALTQSFTVAPGSTVMLSFQMFVNNYYADGAVVNPAGLDYTAYPNQHVQVDILTGSAGALDNGSGVIDHLYLGGDLVAGGPNPYADYSFNLTPYVGAGGTFQLRFGEVDNQLFQNLGVDNVSIDAVTGSVPEPSSLGMLGLGLLGLVGVAWFRRRTVG